MNISNMNKKNLLKLGLDSVINVHDGRVGFYRGRSIGLNGPYPIANLFIMMGSIDDEWVGFDESDENIYRLAPRIDLSIN